MTRPHVKQPIDLECKIRTARSESDAMISLVRPSVDHLREYRSALITAVVTGQTDVSSYAKSGTLDRGLDAIQEEIGT